MNNKNLEIERKFLVLDDSFKTLAVRKLEIVQGYLCKEHGRTVRVRIRDNEAFLTIKGKPVTDDGSQAIGNGIAHFEWEKAIEMEDAKQLLRLALPGLIEKTRWIVPAIKVEGRKVIGERDLFWEVDEFHGALEGFVMAEIELEEENQTFEKPAFIGEEVTGDPRYNNTRIIEAFGKHL